MLRSLRWATPTMYRSHKRSYRPAPRKGLMKLTRAPSRCFCAHLTPMPTAKPFEAALTAGTSHLLIIHGSRDDPQLLSVASATAGGVDSGRIRFVHAVAGAAPLDVRINDQLVLPALAFAAPSQHIALPSGSQRIALYPRPGGDHVGAVGYPSRPNEHRCHHGFKRWFEIAQLQRFYRASGRSVRSRQLD